MTAQVEVHGTGPYVHVPAVEWIMRDLRIKQPVSIWWVDHLRSKRTAGVHLRTAKGDHVIKLRKGLSIAEASKTLCHELVHAAQAEKLGADWHRSFKREAAKGYTHGSRYEAEARAKEDDLAAKYRPVR